MPWVETNRTNVVNRLIAEGWIAEDGAKHDKFSHPGRRYKIMVPRHRVLAMGTARSVAKSAGWR